MQSKFDAFREGPLSVFAELRDRKQVEIESHDTSAAANDVPMVSEET